MRRSSLLVATLLLTGLALTVPGGSATPAVHHPQVSANARAVAAVRTAVTGARSGAALPRKTVPALGPDLARSKADLGRCDYGDSHTDAGGRLCRRGDTHAARTVLLLGDSHGRHWVPALEAIARQRHWRAYYLVKEQCTASLVANGDPAEAQPAAPWAACHDFREWALHEAAVLDPALVVVSTSTPTKGVFTQDGYTNDPAKMVGPYERGFRKLFAELHATTDARVVMLRDVPARAPGTAPESCFRRAGATQRTCLSRQNSQTSRIRLVNAAVRAATKSQVEVVNPTPWFCWEGVCPVSIGRYLPYRNSAHITVPYSRHLAGALGELLRM